MAQGPFGSREGIPPRERILQDLAAECAHLALRPRWESEGYVCDTCQRELTTIEAEEVSSEATVRSIGHQFS